MSLLGTIGAIVGTGKQVVETGKSLFGGDEPDPEGTRSVGSGPRTATIFEDRTDQSGKEPAKILVNGTGSWDLRTIGGQGFWRAVSVQDGYELVAKGTGGEEVTITGPTPGRKVNLRDRGLLGASFVSFEVREVGSGLGGGFFGGGGAGGSPGDGAPRRNQAGTSPLVSLLVLGAVAWIGWTVFQS